MFRLALLNMLAFTGFHIALGSPGFDECPGQEILVTETLRVGTDLVNLTVPGCPGFVPKPYPIDPTESLLARRSASSRLARRENELEERSASVSPSECSDPSICQCGVSCAVTCQTADASAPNPSVANCESLISILNSFQNTIGHTFVQGTGFPNPTIVDFSTCRVAFGNINSNGANIEYCWDGLAGNVAQVLDGCIAPNIEQSGDCTASSDQFELSVGGYPRVG